MLTVACVWVHANVPYGVEYVEKLNSMVGRYLNRPFRFVCLTDAPQMVPSGVKPVHIGHPKGMFGWWAKVQLFNPDCGLTGRVLYLDLDTLIVNSLDPIVDFPAEFALVPHAGTFNGKNGLAVVKRFNSSVMVWDAGTQDHIFTDWSKSIARSLWGDQDWIGMQCPDAATMPLAWFPRVSQMVLDASSYRGGRQWIWNGPPKEAKVVLCKTPKNEELAQVIPAFAEAWG